MEEVQLLSSQDRETMTVARPDDRATAASQEARRGLRQQTRKLQRRENWESTGQRMEVGLVEPAAHMLKRSRAGSWWILGERICVVVRCVNRPSRQQARGKRERVQWLEDNKRHTDGSVFVISRLLAMQVE